MSAARVVWLVCAGNIHASDPQTEHDSNPMTSTRLTAAAAAASTRRPVGTMMRARQPNRLGDERDPSPDALRLAGSPFMGAERPVWSRAWDAAREAHFCVCVCARALAAKVARGQTNEECSQRFEMLIAIRLSIRSAPARAATPSQRGSGSGNAGEKSERRSLGQASARMESNQTEKIRGPFLSGSRSARRDYCAHPSAGELARE